MLPEEFASYTQELFGEERWQRYLDAFSEETPVSIRCNPFKAPFVLVPWEGEKYLCEPVPWCRNAYYLKERPNFTRDPLLHAGAYYVQEASSMFLDEVLRQHLPAVIDSSRGESLGMVLDLCAAPGGKSTLLRAALPDDVILMSNEPDHRRANILMENLQKQGHRNVIVTNNYPRDYKRAGLMFDVILTDVPCSGEGMFRKDESTIKEWSLQNVMKCQELQRSIVSDIWQCLRPGGLLIYSTCTFNTREDEENVRWIKEELGAEILKVETQPEWNITGSLLKGWDAPVYRFIPGTTRGEGLFMAVLKKDNQSQYRGGMSDPRKAKGLRILSDGFPQGTIKGKNTIPAHAEALLAEMVNKEMLPLSNGEHHDYESCELSLDDALRYLHHEAIVLPSDTPKGFVMVKYQGLPLGFVKNIGNRANNLYPQEWKIRNL